MPQANLRNSGLDPYLYLEGNSGSTAVGLVGATDVFNIVVVDSASDIEPDSGSPSISIDPNLNGDIEFRPKGIGQSTFINGDVEILGDAGTPGNLLMQNTTAGGLAGVIEYGGNRFVHNAGTDNTFVGSLAGNLGTTGNSSVAVGTNALNNDTSLVGMTAVGFDALTTLSSGIQNTAVGYSALGLLTTGNQNTAVGYQSLAALTAPGIGGGLNAAYGNASLRASNLGRFNTALGCQALVLQNGNGTNDIFNTAVGCQAGSSMTSGKENTLVGALVANSLLTGDYNVIVGELAASSFTTNESSNIIIGGRTGTVGDNNTIRIGAQGTGPHQQNKCFIAGVNGVSVTAAGTVVVSSSGQLGSMATVPMTWTEVTGTSQAMAVSGGYIANNAGVVTLTLPATAALGDTVQVLGKGAGGWLIAQNAGQTIHFGISNTTTGAGGSLASTQRYNCVRLRCITANTDWIVTGEVQGTLTVV